MRIKRGSGLVDYVIPTLVLGVVIGVGVMALSGNNLLLNFLTHSGNAKYNNGKLAMSSQGSPDAVNKAMIIAATTVKQANSIILPGQLNGTEEVPVSQCKGDSCSIDFGTFVLNGVPANYDEMVETIGVPGGTDKMLALIDEIIKQAEKLDPPVDLSMLKQLSNQGHALASLQKETEDRALDVRMSIDKKLNFQLQKMKDSQSDAFLMNQKIQATLTQLNKKFGDTTNQTHSNILNTVNILAQDILKTNKAYTDKMMDTYISGMLMAKEYTSIMDMDSVDAGKMKDSAKSIAHPKFSIHTNVNSTIICTTGKYKDTGKKCN